MTEMGALLPGGFVAGEWQVAARAVVHAPGAEGRELGRKLPLAPWVDALQIFVPKRPKNSTIQAVEPPPDHPY